MPEKVKYKRKAIEIPLTEYFIIKCEAHGILGVYTRDPDKVYDTHIVEVPHFSGTIRKYYFYLRYDNDFLTEMN